MIKPYFQEKGITIYHADNLDVLPCFPTIPLPGQNLLLTDPPYGIGFAARPTKWQRLKGNKAKQWDNESGTMTAINLARELCQLAIIWGGNYFWLPRTRCVLAWGKPDAPPSMGNVEFAWTNLDQKSMLLMHSISATNGERMGHPTQKPLRVIMWALQLAMAEKKEKVKMVFDPWMGSGTSLVAAKLKGLQAIGIEREEEYCEMAAERLRQGVLLPC